MSFSSCRHFRIGRSGRVQSRSNRSMQPAEPGIAQDISRHDALTARLKQKKEMTQTQWCGPNGPWARTRQGRRPRMRERWMRHLRTGSTTCWTGTDIHVITRPRESLPCKHRWRWDPPLLLRHEETLLHVLKGRRTHWRHICGACRVRCRVSSRTSPGTSSPLCQIPETMWPMTASLGAESLTSLSTCMLQVVSTDVSIIPPPRADQRVGTPSFDQVSQARVLNQAPDSLSLNASRTKPVPYKQRATTTCWTTRSTGTVTAQSQPHLRESPPSSSIWSSNTPHSSAQALIQTMWIWCTSNHDLLLQCPRDIRWTLWNIRAAFREHLRPSLTWARRTYGDSVWRFSILPTLLVGRNRTRRVQTRHAAYCWLLKLRWCW